MSNMLFPIICGNQMANNILHIRIHLSLFYPPLYNNLFDNFINGIASLFPVKFDPFHPFHFIIQEPLAFHSLFNKLEIQAYTIYGCLFTWTALCKNNYCRNNVASMVMVFSLPILQILPCHLKILRISSHYCNFFLFTTKLSIVYCRKCYLRHFFITFFW